MRVNGWHVLAGVCAVLAVLGTVGALWDGVVDGQWTRLFLLPLSLLMWYWFGVGALRRARRAELPQP